MYVYLYRYANVSNARLKLNTHSSDFKNSLDVRSVHTSLFLFEAHFYITVTYEFTLIEWIIRSTHKLKLTKKVITFFKGINLSNNHKIQQHFIEFKNDISVTDLSMSFQTGERIFS